MDDPVDGYEESPRRGRICAAAEASIWHAQVEAVLCVFHSPRADAGPRTVLTHAHRIEIVPRTDIAVVARRNRTEAAR